MKLQSLTIRLFIFGMALLFSSCLKKDLELEVSQSGCSFFSIYSPDYTTLTDPTCTGSTLVATYLVSFYYSGSASCLNKIVIDPETLIEDADGHRIDSATYRSAYYDSTGDFSLDTIDRWVTFQFEVTFASAADAQRYNDGYVTFHCENYEGHKTKSLFIRFIGACSVPPNVGPPFTTINVMADSLRVTLWDDGDTDGDLISVYLNGQWVLIRFPLTSSKATFTWPFVQGADNDLTFLALNQGRDGPIDCSVIIGMRSWELHIRMDTPVVIRVR